MICVPCATLCGQSCGEMWYLGNDYCRDMGIANLNGHVSPHACVSDALQEAHDQDKLGKPQFKTLNLGLAAAGAAHFIVGVLNLSPSAMASLAKNTCLSSVNTAIKETWSNRSWTQACVESTVRRLCTP